MTISAAEEVPGNDPPWTTESISGIQFTNSAAGKREACRRCTKVRKPVNNKLACRQRVLYGSLPQVENHPFKDNCYRSRKDAAWP